MDRSGSLGKPGEARFDEGTEWVELKLEANLFMQVCVFVCQCVCMCVHVDLGLASSAVVLEDKTTVPNSLVHHQLVFQLCSSGGLGNHSRPPTWKRKENNT